MNLGMRISRPRSSNIGIVRVRRSLSKTKKKTYSIPYSWSWNEARRQTILIQNLMKISILARRVSRITMERIKITYQVRLEEVTDVQAGPRRLNHPEK
jgi:hypothetical protein